MGDQIKSTRNVDQCRPAVAHSSAGEGLDKEMARKQPSVATLWIQLFVLGLTSANY